MSYKQGPRPDGSVRRSQLLTRAGPGALVDLVGHAIVVGGLDAWRYSSETEGFFSEPRLQASAQRLLQAVGEGTSGLVRLRRPPECTDDAPSPSRGIGAAQFPSWFLCQNGRCRSLVHWRGLDDRGRHVCSEDTPNGFPVVPFRFVAACPRGHLMDIHWRHFVHRGRREEDLDDDDWSYCRRQPGSGRANDPLGDKWHADLYILGVGTSGDMSDYIVGCRRCGVTRGLQDLAIKGMLGRCQGWRPWLGPRANEDCTEEARLLMRTASNAYFPQCVSVLSIPDSSLTVRKAVDEVWDLVKKVSSAEQLRLLISMQEPLARALRGIDEEAVLEEIQRRQLEVPVAAAPIREAEWRELMSAPPEIPGELPARGEDWFARHADTLALPSFLDRVVLIQSLKEVRAQVGFTRLEGFSADAEGEFALDGQRTAPLSLSADWIPAVEIRGEGVFIAFNERALRAWEASSAVQRREQRFREALKIENEGRNVTTVFTGARLLMLHSLAHMLITQISLECGYAASAIRERIYCYRHESEDEAEAIARSRAGILLYTGTPGSEGTLGGLVEVGRDILRHLRKAAERGQLCSNDPVCAQHDPAGEEEGRYREGAACHACLLIAEPSCERMNRDLDRALVVPTVEEVEAAFLGGWVGQPAERGVEVRGVPVVSGSRV